MPSVLLGTADLYSPCSASPQGNLGSDADGEAKQRSPFGDRRSTPTREPAASSGLYRFHVNIFIVLWSMRSCIFNVLVCQYFNAVMLFIYAVQKNPMLYFSVECLPLWLGLKYRCNSSVLPIGPRSLVNCLSWEEFDAESGGIPEQTLQLALCLINIGGGRKSGHLKHFAMDVYPPGNLTQPPSM